MENMVSKIDAQIERLEAKKAEMLKQKEPLYRERKELELAGYFDEDAMYGGALGGAIMELLKVFKKQGHSGYSARFTAKAFYRLTEGKPLTALTGEDDEWETRGGFTQNKRCSAVFKEKDGTAKYIEALLFSGPHGTYWGNATVDKNGNRVSSSQPVTLPFVPKTFYIQVEDIDGVSTVVNQSELQLALDYFKGKK
jgi:hypothetical protein